MDLKSLEAVLWIDRLGGFKAAAEALRMTQPAISIRVSQLEAMLETRIFHRSGKRVVPTPVGVTLIHYAERILQLRDEALLTIKGHNEENGILRLGTVETTAHTWLAQLLCRIDEKYPNITVDLDIGISDDIQRKVAKGMLDVGLFMGPVNSPMMIETPVCSFEVALLAHRTVVGQRGGRTDLGSLPALPIMTFSRNTVPHSMLHRLLGREGGSHHRVHAMSSVPTIVSMLLSGAGLALLPPDVVREHLDSGALCRLDVGQALPPLNCVAGRLMKYSSGLVEDVVAMARNVAQSAGA
ncbi:transcriptional regulator, LysR family [Gluconacetobacter diazotrophicus PA1 5]|uniref:LysR substrate-binding domain-containing protein n=1 Tax=Gluconacetobacter diazotrophicus TaxID=33996 RepID=UPI000173C28D|nr:LysR family transcriptional regulator [Gluconacetobacter diazotrophicus]ACI52012.1 transcriptional regulator, LysR family [Gluconacetobacter diazotrophicus PA1 5]